MARILKRSQRKMESTIDVPTESEYKAFQDLRSHLIMLKNGLPYFEESIHPVMEVLKVKDKVLNQHNKDAYRLGSTYQSRPFELVDTAPLKKAFEADQFKLHEMKKEISKCSKELEHYRYEWQTIIKPPKEMLKDFFIVRVSPEVNEIFNKHIDYLQDRLDHLKLYENGYYLESCNLNCFLKDMNYYKEHYEKDLVEYKDKIKMYERICEPESRLIDRNKYLGMNYKNLSVENIQMMTKDYEKILDERICQVEAKLKEMESIKELRKDEMDKVEIRNDTNEKIMDEERKDAILHCLADETLEYVYDRTSTGFYYVSTDDLRFTANERFDINLTDEDLSKIYDYMNWDFYVLDSECEWDEDENGEYFGIAVGSDRVNGGYEFDDYCDMEEERYELRQTLFDEMCGQNPIAYDADIDKAIETMNKGVYEYLDSDRFKTLLDTMSKFHDYSMNNTLLILGQNPHATHLAGYNKWQQDFNRQVKRGEKGLMIWMPVEIKVKENHYVLDENGNRILGDDGKFKREEVVVKKHTFKIGYTFDVSQTEQIEGKEVIELSPVKELEGDVKDYQALTKALMEISPVPITIEAFEGSAKGCYNPLTNEIKIQPDMSEVQTLKTMIHEIAHSIVHSEENLNQLKQKENIEFSKSEREVQAESIAYIVSSHLGIDTSDYSFPYVATWGLSTEPSDLENVKQNLKCIKSTSFDLTSKIDTYMEQLQAQREQNKVNVQIAINWSENGTVAQYSEESNIAPEDKLSFAEANELLKRMNDHLKDTMLGYDKTDYEITLYKENDADPYVYSGRYDIGSENGDIIDTICHYLDWKIEHDNDQNALLFKNDFIPEAEAGRKLSVDEAKRVDKIFDEMLKRELKYKTINFTREHFETVDTARDVMRVEEKMDELYNNGDISGKTHDEVLNHLSEVEEALYERIKDNMENNFLFKTQVENAVNADGEFGYKRALYNQDDVYRDVVKDVLEIDDLQKDADEMEL